jgi:TRAP-type C4-dicarboxylate transport system substrate-binding protein
VVSRKPTKRLADFSRQKIRVLASETEIGVIAGLGASPTPMPLNEVTAALQQGTIDGASTVLDVFVALKTAEVAPNGVDTGLWYTISLASVSKKWFDSLPADLRQAVLDTAKEVEARMFTRQLERQSQNEGRWKKAGGILVKLPEDEQRKALEMADRVAESFLAKNADLREMYTLIRNAK